MKYEIKDEISLKPISKGASSTWWYDEETSELYKWFPPAYHAGTGYINRASCIRKVTEFNIDSMNIPSYVLKRMKTKYLGWSL
tara:strand:+ start:447 stop:695 length:249 start_codon:yes stop_codon:yes gene_type:complete